MGYECSLTFFCANPAASRLRAGLGSLFIAEAGRSEATLGDGTVVAFKSDWDSSQANAEIRKVRTSVGNYRRRQLARKIHARGPSSFAIRCSPAITTG
jgi:hypothetical protein